MVLKEPYCLGIKANWNNSLKKKKASKLKRAPPLNSTEVYSLQSLGLMLAAGDGLYLSICPKKFLIVHLSGNLQLL